MVDVTTKKPLTVTPNGGVWPYIELPFSQLAEVERLLTDCGVRYAV